MSMDDSSRNHPATGSDLDVERGSDVPISPRSTGSSPTRSTLVGCCPAPGSPGAGAWCLPCASTRTPFGRFIGGCRTPATSRVAMARARTWPIVRPSAAAPKPSPALFRRCCAAPRMQASPQTRWPRRPSRPPPNGSVRARSSGCSSRNAQMPDAGYDAERLTDEFPGLIEVEGSLLDDLPDRLDRFHYDLVATTTFHADEARPWLAVGFRSWRCSSARATWSSSTRSRGCRRAPRSGLSAPRTGRRKHPRDAGPRRNHRDRTRDRHDPR